VAVAVAVAGVGAVARGDVSLASTLTSDVRESPTSAAGRVGGDTDRTGRHVVGCGLGSLPVPGPCVAPRGPGGGHPAIIAGSPAEPDTGPGRDERAAFLTLNVGVAATLTTPALAQAPGEASLPPRRSTGSGALFASFMNTSPARARTREP
jgi:hypothetical protein